MNEKRGKKWGKKPYLPKNRLAVPVQVSSVPVQASLYHFLHNLYQYKLDLYRYTCSNFSFFFKWFYLYIFANWEQ